MTQEQNERYKRHIILPQIGEQGQKKLLNSHILVVGAGGLGVPVLQYLAAAGVGVIGIVDPDTVSLSNLQRQVLYKENQVGELKVDKAKEALLGLNSHCTINTYAVHFNEENAERIIPSYDIVIGATDNFASRSCIDAFSKKHSIPFVHGSIGEFEGQVSVFNYNGGPSYTDLFPDILDETKLPLGVLGVLPGIIGSIMACEAIKIVIGNINILSGKLLVYDAIQQNMQVFRISKD